jgi:hypothetical protein
VVPEVDRLSVRIVSDIIVRRNVSSQKLAGLTIDRAQPNETPDAPPRTTLVGEWGLSMHAESQRGDEVRNFLVDFGYNPVTLLNNMEILKIAPEKFDALVLSHGHSTTWFGAKCRGRSSSQTLERVTRSPPRACPAKVGTGFAKKDMLKQSDRAG